MTKINSLKLAILNLCIFVFEGVILSSFFFLQSRVGFRFSSGHIKTHTDKYFRLLRILWLPKDFWAKRWYAVVPPNFFNSICPSMLYLFLYCIVLQYYSITLLQCSTSRVLLLCEELHQYNGSITHSLHSSLFVIKILIQPVQASAILITSSLAETFSSSPPTEATSMKWCCSCWC